MHLYHILPKGPDGTFLRNTSMKGILASLVTVLCRLKMMVVDTAIKIMGFLWDSRVIEDMVYGI